MYLDDDLGLFACMQSLFDQMLLKAIFPIFHNNLEDISSQYFYLSLKSELMKQL